MTSSGKQHYHSCLAPKEHDIQLLLACNAHLGSRNLDPCMARYLWKRRDDGIHLINLAKTWEKLVLAARVIVAIENPADVCLITSQLDGKPIAQRAVLKFAQYTGATTMSGRFTPGTFTNQIQEKFMESRLLIVSDPRADHQPLTEASYVNLPTIAFCNTDSPVKFVDIAIPINNRSVESVGLMYWLLAREVLRLRKVIPRNQPWDVMVDVFFYRPPEEQEKKALEEQRPFEEKAFVAKAAAPSVEWGGAVAEPSTWEQTTTNESTWGAPTTATESWGDIVPEAPTGWDSNPILTNAWDGQ